MTYQRAGRRIKVAPGCRVNLSVWVAEGLSSELTERL